MPDSRAFWEKAESKQWTGPFYGYQTLDLLLGESDTAQQAGHYANWLKQNYPEAVDLLKPEFAQSAPPEDLDEIWRSAMPVECHYNTWISDQSASFIEAQAGRETPFFLFVSYPDPHHPFDPPEEYADRYKPADIPLPEIGENELSGRPPYCDKLFTQGEGFRKLYWMADEGAEAGSTITTEDISDDSMKTAIAYTYGMIEMIDDGVGRILDALKRSGFADNTIVIFTTDHGEYLGAHGLLHKGPASYRQLTEVSMLMKGPGIAAGLEVNSLTSHIDFVPTLLEMTGRLSEDSSYDGLSLTPLLSGETKSIREYTFGEYHPTVRSDLYNQTVYTDKWRYTIYPEMPDWGELFDLENDPSERQNLFFEPDVDQLKRELGEILAQKFPPQPSVENKALCKW
jgi:arylsulfatase A-like enzyme